MGIRCLAFDYGRTIGGDDYHKVIGMSPVTAEAATMLHTVHGLGIRLVLASNTKPNQDRRLALVGARVMHLFSDVLLSHELKFRKPDPRFYAAVLDAAGCGADEILWVGNNLATDIIGPMEHGMRAALLRPDGMATGEILPEGAVMIRSVAEVPGLVDPSGKLATDG